MARLGSGLFIAVVFQFQMHESHLEGLLQQILGLNPRVSNFASLGSAKEFAFLTHSQVVLILLVPEFYVVALL